MGLCGKVCCGWLVVVWMCRGGYGSEPDADDVGGEKVEDGGWKKGWWKSVEGVWLGPAVGSGGELRFAGEVG